MRTSVFRHFLLAAGLCLSGAAPGAAQPAPATASAPRVPSSGPLSPEDFAELPYLADPRLSPDGERIAARIINGNHERVGIWRLSDPREQPPQIVDIDHVDSFAWAGDSRLIVETVTFGAMRSANLIMMGPMRRILAYDLNDRTATPLGDARGLFSDTIFIDPLGRYALIADQPSLRGEPNIVRVDLASGASVEVQRRVPGVWGWFADSNGVIRVGIDYNARGARIHYRATPDGPLQRVRTQRDLPDDSVVDSVRFASDTDRGVIVTNAVTGRFGVYAYDFATDTRGEAIFEHPEVDVTGAIIGPNGAVDGIGFQDDRPRVHWLNRDMADVQRRIDRTFPGKTNMVDQPEP